MHKLKEQFFEVFEIEPKTNREYGHEMIIYNEACTEELKFYLPITDSHYLDLICILNQYFNASGQPPIMVLGLHPEALKEHILRRCIHYSDEIKSQIQELFTCEKDIL